MSANFARQFCDALSLASRSRSHTQKRVALVYNARALRAALKIAALFERRSLKVWKMIVININKCVSEVNSARLCDRFSSFKLEKKLGLILFKDLAVTGPGKVDALS